MLQRTAMDAESPGCLREVAAAIRENALNVFPLHPGQRWHGVRRVTVAPRRRSIERGQNLIGVNGLRNAFITSSRAKRWVTSLLGCSLPEATTFGSIGVVTVSTSLVFSVMLRSHSFSTCSSTGLPSTPTLARCPPGGRMAWQMSNVAGMPTASTATSTPSPPVNSSTRSTALPSVLLIRVVAPKSIATRSRLSSRSIISTGSRRIDVLNGDMPVADWLALDRTEALLVDVREPDEFADGHIPNAINLPLSQMRDRYAELPTNPEIWTCCGVGQRAYFATRFLMQHIDRSRNLSGGYTTYQAYGAIGRNP